MRITPQRPERRDVAPAERPATSPTAPAVRPAAAAEASGAALLEPAQAALREQPEIDLERVAAVKAALARGEAPFDPERLAALIDRYHGGRG